MHDAQFMQVLYATYDLLEELARLDLLKFLFFDDVVKQFTSTGILCDEKELFGRLDNFKELNYVRVTDPLQNVDFAGDSLDVSLLNNLLLLEYFDRNLIQRD